MDIIIIFDQIKIRGPHYINSKLQFICKNGYISYDGNDDRALILKCSSLKWNLYETNKNFVWCPTNATSYLLGRPKAMLTEKINYEYLAGICYDTQYLSLKSICYKIDNVLQPTHLNTFYKPELELKYIKETFPIRRINSTHYNHPDIQDWINFAQYNYSSIIQNSILFNEFNHELGSFLDLAWWPNLRLGNWQRYERALTAHIQKEHQAYDVVAGISSVARAPVMATCENNFTLIELKDNKNREIPMYVWNYLRSTINSSDEIVIIGFNSPFYEFYSKKDIVFCPDKCHEISWLKKISTTFHYNALGVIFCCSVEDVKLSKRLDGFPEIN
ncbi:uncharacterized protein ACRADG_005493 isoform 2-T2 [Cochliomyia hominivorax]